MPFRYEQLVLDADDKMWCSPFAQEGDEVVLIDPDADRDAEGFRKGRRFHAKDLTPTSSISDRQAMNPLLLRVRDAVTIVDGAHAGETGWIGYRPPDAPVGLMPVILDGETIPSRVAWCRISQVRPRVRIDGH